METSRHLLDRGGRSLVAGLVIGGLGLLLLAASLLVPAGQLLPTGVDVPVPERLVAVWVLLTGTVLVVLSPWRGGGSRSTPMSILRRSGRRLVKVTAVTLVPLLGATAFLFAIGTRTNTGNLSFENELAIPPLAEPTTDAQGRKVFDLTMQAGQTELLPGTTTHTWGVNGTYLGPTLRASRGDTVQVNLRNRLEEASTTMHWHGMHLPAAADGGPHQLVEPGATWSPSWKIDQPAATLWYHPHPHRQTADQVYRGAAGMFILDDPAEADLELPSSYGMDDVPLIVQDKQIGEDGELGWADALGTIGILGDEILVNGTYDPRFDVTTELLRLRVLNASNARVYDLGFDDQRPFWLIGTDSGLLSAPVEQTHLPLAPGERAEIVVAFQPGEEVTLRSDAPDIGVGWPYDRLLGGADTFELLRLTAADELAPSPKLPARLAAVEPLREEDADAVRTFTLGELDINGLNMDMQRIDAEVPVGSTEVWEVTNASGDYHTFHPHLVHFQVLDYNGGPVPDHLTGWKDNVFLPAGTSVRIIARFTDHTDPQLPYMFHCHLLTHEDGGMMGQFTVVDA